MQIYHLHRTACLWYTEKNGKEQKPMHEYEVLIETINPCGGEAHSKKEFLDIEAESPEA